MPNRDTEKTQIILTAGAIISSVLIIGVAGFMSIEDFTFLEALYMTIITVSTVGFGELHDLSDTGRIFTTFLIISSLGAFTYSLSIITRHIFEGQIGNIIGKYKKKQQKKMKNHVIVVGYGRNGKQTVSELLHHKKRVLVIENNHDIILDNSKESFSFLEGDATEDETLLQAEVNNATTLVSTLPNDAQNLFIVLTARSLNPKLTIISRASSESAEKKLRMAGVDHIVMPEKVGGMHMARLVARSNIVEFLDYLSIRGSSPTIIEEINCEAINENLINKSLYELEIRKKTGANIIGLKTVQGEYIINPSPEAKLKKNVRLYVLGTHEQIKLMKEILSDMS
jgi:voltage-gated potassium channel